MQNKLIIDCSCLIYASFYANGVNALSYDGQSTGVIYGFLKKILALCEKFQTNKIYFCWDSKRENSLRKKQYPIYKENRNKKEKTKLEKYHKKLMNDQALELLNYTLPNLGFVNLFVQDGYEGDDIIFLVVDKINLHPKNKIVVTNDADMYQLLNKCIILNPSTMKLFDEKMFVDRYKVLPSQWSLAKAIGGCVSDGVIGIQGASDPKNETSKALKYILGEIKNGKVYDRIRSKEGQNIIKNNLSLVTLPFNPKNINNIKLKSNKITKKKLVSVFDEYRFKSFLKKETLQKWEKVFIK